MFQFFMFLSILQEISGRIICWVKRQTVLQFPWRIYSLFTLEASGIMKNIGESIQFLHAINIAHRDVKVSLDAFTGLLPEESACIFCSVLIFVIFPMPAWEFIVCLKEAKRPTQAHWFWLC